MNNKIVVMFFAALAAISMVIFSACNHEDAFDGIEETGTVIGPDGNVIPDSILASDSLYTWYLDQLAKNKNAAQDSSVSKDSMAKPDVPKDSVENKSDSTGSTDNPGNDSPDITGNEEEEEEQNLEPKAHLLPSAGFYSELTIPVPETVYGGVIRCTFDGSMPTPATAEFKTPYTVTRNTPVRCAEFIGDSIARKSSHTFFINETVSMPVVAISVDPYDMFDSKNGYYSQGVSYCSEPCYTANYWKDIELPVHVEFFENGSNSEKKDWQIDAGISIIGQWSRYRAKKSVAIKMKKEYQDGRLKYALFKTRPEANKFKAFNLRNNGNRFVSDYIEDPMLASLMEGSGVDYQRSRQVVVYYNGSFHGIYDMRERLNEHFIETNYGIDSKQVDMVKHVGREVTASGGTVDAYNTLLNHVHSSNFSGTNNQAYSLLSTMMDVGNFADYMAAEIYIHNGDWPDNNVRAWRTADQPFKFMLFDLDHGFGWPWNVDGFSNSTTSGTNMFSWIKQGGTNRCYGSGCFAEIYIKLIANPDFKRLFINHSSVMLDYYLTYDKVVAATDAMAATIGSAEKSRDLSMYPRDYGISFDATGTSLTSYAYTRTETVRDEFRNEFSLGDDITVTIAADGNGKVLLDGMSLPSTSYTGKFFGGNDMLLEAIPKGSATFVGWTDGNGDNPRLVSPENRSSYTAIFR